MITLYDAARCPYCARVRIVLAEKGVEYETVEIDLADRPAWLYEKNPRGKVPVLEEDDFVLPESAVIMEYLEERYPEPALLPADPADRARRPAAGSAASTATSATLLRAPPRRGRRRGAARRPARRARRVLEGSRSSAARGYGLADIALRAVAAARPAALGVDLAPFAALAGWLERLVARPAVAAELGVVAAL